MTGSKEQMEGREEEGQVAHQLEALAVEGSPAQQVVEGQPVKGRAHGAQAGVPQPQPQEVVEQALQAGGRASP